MKKLLFMSLALGATCVSAFAGSANFPSNSKPWENLSQNLKVINVCNLTDNLDEIMQGHHPEIAVEFSAQTTLPISFFLKGDLVNLAVNEGDLGALEIKQTFYVRCVQQELILSTNLTDWKPFLEFITGNLSVSLNVQDGKPSLLVGTEINQSS